MKIAIIGTGPTAVSAAQAVLDSGQTATFIDTSITSAYPHRTSKLYIENRKLRHNSAFPYENFFETKQWKTKNTIFSPSFAKGGFTQVWGAALFEQMPKDFGLENVDPNDFIEAYARIYSFLPAWDSANKNSEKFNRLLKHYLKRQKYVRDIATSSLGVYPPDSNSNLKCQFHLTCLSGCPENAIWSSDQEINRFLSEGFSILTDLRVESFHLTPKGYSLISQNFKSEEIILEYFDILILGCGVLESHKILKNSGYVSEKTIISDSQIFYGLGIIFNSQKKQQVLKKPPQLAQMYLSITKNNLASSFFQLYNYSDTMLARSKVLSLRIFKRIFGIFQSLLNKYFFVYIGYLGSEKSGHLGVDLSNDEYLLNARNSYLKKVQIFLHVNLEIFKANKILFAGRSFAFPFAVKLGRTGEGFHVGRNANLELTELPDTLVIADASNVKRVPPGPITLGLMAFSYVKTYKALMK